MNDELYISIREKAIRNTHKKMLEKNPEDKEALDLILKIKLEILKK